MVADPSPLATFSDRHTLVYERTYPHDIDLVWDAVSTAEHLDVWMLPESRVERRVGGACAFGWGGSADDPAASRGTVTIFEPPTTIEYTFEDDSSVKGGGSFMRFDLSPDGESSTRLLFTLRFVPAHGDDVDHPYEGGDLPAGPNSAWRPGFLAGYHEMLDDLRGYLVGEWSAADRAAHLEHVDNEHHLALIKRYRDHIRTTCP